MNREAPGGFVEAMRNLADSCVGLDWRDECQDWKHQNCDCDRVEQLIEAAQELANRYYIPAWDRHGNEMREMILKLIEEARR